MLSCDEQADLATAICATAEILGQTLSAAAAELMAKDLAEYPVEVIANALRACRRELTGKLTLAAVLQRIHADDGRPGRDEAWAIALQAGDERDTVVITGEIMAALQVARPILEARDKVGARMAFIGAYERLVAQARQQALPVKWLLSLGFDADLRNRAIEQARELGRLPAPEAERLLLRYQHSLPTGNGAAIAGLLTGSVGAPDPATRQRLQAIRDELQERRRRKDVQRRWDQRLALRAIQRRKAQLLQQVADLQAGEDEIRG